MLLFGSKLRERAKDLGISNADVARRIGLSERRYAHSVRGVREPDLGTLVRIARVLGTTPDGLLGVLDDGPPSERQSLLDRLNFAAQAMDDRDLTRLVAQAEALAALGEPDEGPSGP